MLFSVTFCLPCLSICLVCFYAFVALLQQRHYVLPCPSRLLFRAVSISVTSQECWTNFDEICRTTTNNYILAKLEQGQGSRICYKILEDREQSQIVFSIASSNRI